MARSTALLLIALSALACERTPIPPAADKTAEPMQEAGPDVTRLLGGLARGNKLGPLEVVSVGATRKGRIPVQIKKGEASGELEITLQGSGPNPPVSTAKYAIYFSSPRPNTLLIPEPDLTAACEELATRIRAQEASVPTPAGMTTYGATTKEM